MRVPADPRFKNLSEETRDVLLKAAEEFQIFWENQHG